MKFADLLGQKQSLIVDQWLHRILESYPGQSAIFMKKEKDQFANPVGHHLSQGLALTFAALIQGADRDQMLAALDEVIRIRALQNFSPSQALAFIFLLKNVLREELAPELKDGQFSSELQELETMIDGMALLGFEVYTQWREKLYEIRVTEVKQRVSGFLRSKGMDVNGF
jgi:hypothetical protein